MPFHQWELNGKSKLWAHKTEQSPPPHLFLCLHTFTYPEFQFRSVPPCTILWKQWFRSQWKKHVLVFLTWFINFFAYCFLLEKWRLPWGLKPLTTVYHREHRRMQRDAMTLAWREGMPSSNVYLDIHYFILMLCKCTELIVWNVYSCYGIFWCLPNIFLVLPRMHHSGSHSLISSSKCETGVKFFDRNTKFYSVTIKLLSYASFVLHIYNICNLLVTYLII